MPGNAKNHLEAAAEYWQDGQPFDAGRLLFECMPADVRPTWAARILRLVREKSRVDPHPFQQVLHSAEHPRQWANGHRAFGGIRDSVLRLDEVSKRQKLAVEQSTLLKLLELAELVAKVTYNAADPYDPFDSDSGWWIPCSLRGFVDLWKDESFSQAAWSALCFPSQVDNRPLRPNMPGKARKHLEAAVRYWREGQPLEAGRLIFECLPTEVRPTWAVGILWRVLNRGSDDLRQVQDEDDDDDIYGTYRRVLEDAEHPRLWADARRAYDDLGGDSESGEEQEPRGLTDPEKTLFRVISLAQLVAKVTYNSSDPPDPFEENSGWRIAEALRGFVDFWKDEKFSQGAWSALCFPFRPV